MQMNDINKNDSELQHPPIPDDEHDGHHPHREIDHHDIPEVHKTVVIKPECPSVSVGLRSRLFWAMGACAFFCSCGDLLVNGNFKTYVKKVITDDEFLTIIGSIGGIGNGCTRYSERHI